MVTYGPGVMTEGFRDPQGTKTMGMRPLVGVLTTASECVLSCTQVNFQELFFGGPIYNVR